MPDGETRIAFCLDPLGDGPSGSDGAAQAFWEKPPSWIAAGKTPDMALASLLANLATWSGRAIGRIRVANFATLVGRPSPEQAALGVGTLVAILGRQQMAVDIHGHDQ
jgi:hypothetical protein